MASSPFDPLTDAFPKLADSGYQETSPATPAYNCIAWAAGFIDRWWWPDSQNQYYWPPGVPRQETVEAFAAAYGQLGFKLCSGTEPEKGIEKVAIFAKGGKPTHAARQLDDGSWTSKLGKLQDIGHSTAESVSGDLYGEVVQLLCRARPR